jgi:hypothetical protein
MYNVHAQVHYRLLDSTDRCIPDMFRNSADCCRTDTSRGSTGRRRTDTSRVAQSAVEQIRPGAAQAAIQ